MRNGARIEEYAQGSRPVLVLKTFPDLARPTNLDAVARANHVHLIAAREPDGLFSTRWGMERLLSEFAGNLRLREYYDDLVELCRRRDVPTVLVMGDGGYWHPEFIGRLRQHGAKIAFWTGDDPEGSALTSRPFVHLYDHAFCGGVFFDATTRIRDKFLEWGARRATFIPLGTTPDKYEVQDGLSDVEYFQYGRDIDLIFVGAPYRQKAWPLLMVKRHFGNRMVLGGRRWDGAGLGVRGLAIRLVTRLGGIATIGEVTNERLRQLYRRARIAFNCHLSYGPSNLRMYETTLNGAMHMCDCRLGLAELFDIPREAIGYDTFSEAIERIEYYLAHEDERLAIAAAGHRRAAANYRIETCFGRLLRELDRGAESVPACTA